jgi:hypothetical protein
LHLVSSGFNVNESFASAVASAGWLLSLVIGIT